MTGPIGTKTLRSDALRNRERLVASARELFAKTGVDVPVEEIVRHAGLGMGTLYRHFPTKEELLDAVLEDAFGEIIGLAEEAAAADDAWAGLEGFLEQALALHVVNRGLKDVLATREHGRERAEAMRARIRPLLRRTIARAPDYWRRYLGFLLDGLRAEGATPLAAPPLTRAQLARATKRREG
jgi:AcrR family transcriptional regulator